MGLLLAVSIASGACGDDPEPKTPAGPAATALPSDYRFDDYDYPGAVGTTLFDIDDDGLVVGYYSAASTVGDFGDTPVHAFVLPPARRAADDFHAPGSDRNTAALGIGPAGEVVGHYVDDEKVVHGYVRSADGDSMEDLDHPGAAETHPFGHNASGHVSGFFVARDETVHGFVWDSESGAFTDFDHPDSTADQTYAHSIHDDGRVVGHFVDDSGVHGFVRAADGETFANFDHPNAGSQTAAIAINGLGQIAGFYVDPDNVTHGYVRSTDGQDFNDVDHPKGVGGTFVFGINDSGQLVGYYVDDSGNNRGFVATPRL